MALIHISGPSGEPVTSADAALRTACRLDGTEFDTLLDTVVIPALRRLAEGKIGRVIGSQVKELVIDQFPNGEIGLNLPDVSGIVSVKYIDTDGVEQTMSGSAYSLDDDSIPGWLFPAYGTEWPDTLDTANAVRVRFNVGVAATEDVKLWIIAHAVQVVQNPAGVTAENIKALPFLDGLLDQHKVWVVA